MAPSHDTRDNLIRNSSGRVYTLSEACEFMKTLDSMPSGMLDVNWVNANTGQPVAIGYTDGVSNNKKKNKITNPFLEVNKKQMFNALSKMHSRKNKFAR